MKEDDRMGIVWQLQRGCLAAEREKSRKARRDGPRLPDTEERFRSDVCSSECVYMCTRVQEGKGDRIEQGLQGVKGAREWQ